MRGRTAIWALAVAVLVTAWPGAALGAQVILPGHEAQVLALVKRALEAQGESPKYDVAIEQTTVRLKIREPARVDLVLHEHGPVHAELAPGVQLDCGTAACTDQQRARWQGLAKALAQERDERRAELWVEVQPQGETRASRPLLASPWLWRLVLALGLGWLLVHSVRCLAALKWRERRWEIATLAVIGVTSALVALGLTAHLPVHEHDSYLARSDCAWMLDCTQDPAGPGWVPGFFRAYGPLLHAFPYSVVNLCRFSLIVAIAAALVARHWLVRSLIVAGWKQADARRAGLWAFGLICLNPLWIRVAVAGTPWPYVLLCLFGAGVALEETQADSTVWRVASGAAATCLLSLAVNSNLVMLTALALLWLGPGMSRTGQRWWLPSAWQIACAMLCLGLSLESLELFREAMSTGANTHASLSMHHVFFDYRFLPPTLGVLMLVGAVVGLKRRSPLWALLFMALITHPTLTNYAGPLLGPNYPVSVLNAFFGESLGGLLAGVGVAWLVMRAPNRTRLATALVAGALLLPLPFAREGWRFLTGSRVAERELAAISIALPKLPPHTQLVIPTRVQPMLGDVKPNGDLLELRFPIGEYLATERRMGRSPPKPLPLEAMSRGDTPSLEAPGTLLYVGASQRSFFREETKAGVVPADLRRTELEALTKHFELVPVSTFELTPDQHPAIPWQLGAGQATRVELGFYWLRPKP